MVRPSCTSSRNRRRTSHDGSSPLQVSATRSTALHTTFLSGPEGGLSASEETAAIARGFHRQIGPPARQFFFMPFEHSEDLADQDHALALFAEFMPGESLRHAQLHRDTIAKFGRFPWRNAALDRSPTAAETRVMQAGGYGALVSGKLSLVDI